MHKCVTTHIRVDRQLRDKMMSRFEHCSIRHWLIVKLHNILIHPVLIYETYRILRAPKQPYLYTRHTEYYGLRNNLTYIRDIPNTTGSETTLLIYETYRILRAPKQPYLYTRHTEYYGLRNNLTYIRDIPNTTGSETTLLIYETYRILRAPKQPYLYTRHTEYYGLRNNLTYIRDIPKATGSETTFCKLLRSCQNINSALCYEIGNEDPHKGICLPAPMAERSEA